MKFYFFAFCILLGVGSALILSNPLGKAGSIGIDLSVKDIQKNIDNTVNNINKMPDLDETSTSVIPDKLIDRYIDKSLVTPTTIPTMQPTIDNQQVSPPKLIGQVNCFKKGYDAVNVRFEPNINSDVITMIDCGKTIEIIDQSDESWIYIQYGNIKGYMYYRAVITQ